MRRLLAALLLVVLFSTPALAHRVSIFAWIEGGMVRTESKFASGRPVKQGAVEVRDAASGALYLSGTTDDAGGFAFAPPVAARSARADLRLVILAGEGHQGEWTMPAAEYLSAAPAAPQPSPAVQAGPSQAPADVPAASAAPGVAGVAPEDSTGQPCPSVALADEHLRAVVREAVAQELEIKLAPFRKALAESQTKGPGMTEIFGGIGWLVGLAGVAAYFSRRKP